MAGTRDRFASYLVRRVFSPGTASAVGSGGGFQFDRRRFLQGAGAAGAGAGAILWLGEAPIVEIKGGVARIAFCGRTCIIDPSLFGSRARISLRRDGDGSWLRLANGTFPGTDLRADFVALIARQLPQWTLKIWMPALNIRDALPLESWLSHQASPRSNASSFRIRVGASVMEGTGLSAALSSTFQVTLSGGADAIRLRGGIDAAAGQVMLRVADRSEASLLDQIGGDARRRATTHLTMSGATLRDTVHLGRNDGSDAIRFASDGPCEIKAEAQAGSPDGNSVLTVEGQGTLAIDTANGGVSTSTAIELERSMLVIPSARTSDAIVAARIARRPHGMQMPGSSATVSGSDDDPLYMRFRQGRTGRIEIALRLHELWVPVSDGDRALISLPARPVRLVVPSGPEPELNLVLATFSTPSCAQGAETADCGLSPPPDPAPPAWKDWADMFKRGQVGISLTDTQGVVLVEGPVAMFKLDDTKLNLSRGEDLLNLTFEFFGFDVEAPNSDRKPHLLRRRSGNGGYAEARVSVIFDSQHIAETRYAESQETKIQHQSKARMSGKSRIGFRFPATLHADNSDDTNWAQRELSVEALTNWSKLARVVNERALEADATYQQQLAVTKIQKETHLPEAMNLIAETLEPPRPDETALELVGRLLLSPACSGNWLTPKKKQTPGTELWHARLDDAGRKSVRAIWSQQMNRHQFNWRDFGKPLAPMTTNAAEINCVNDRVSDPVAMVMRDQLYWEAVAQSSVYGLPALRHIPPPPQDPAHPAPKDQSTDAFQIFGPSRVTRPVDPEYQYITDSDTKLNGKQLFDAGIALATPFADADIILSSLGGSLTAQWIGEPASLLDFTKRTDITLKHGGSLPTGFGLERLTLLTQYGRDIEIETLEKGFLLPLGCRASLVTLTERRIERFENNGSFVAVPICRQFIVVQRPVKAFPGVYQPFEGREFPALTATMITRVTPDLAPMQDFNKFWPKTMKDEKTPAADVEFKWTANGDTAPIISNMMFVSNRILTNVDECTAAAAMYNGEGDDDIARRTARLNGAHCRYALPKGDGDTSFDTDTWLMRVRGRRLPEHGRDSFVMDGVMAGADQPPFYPKLELARVNIQSLDRLLGRQHGLVPLRYNSSYLENGFDPSGSDIYMDIVGTDLKMDVGSQGAAVGGVAKPSLQVAAISRATGLVGGPKRTPPPAPQAPNADLRAPKADLPPSEYDIDDALTGKFTPATFFAGIDAKLLGIVDLATLVSAAASGFSGTAPQLIETFGYGLQDSNTLSEIKAKLGQAVQAIEQAVDALEKGLKDALKKAQNLSEDPDLATFYPDLAQKLTQTKNSLGDAQAALNKPDATLESASKALAKAVTSCNALAKSIDHVLHDPVPPLAGKAMNNLGITWAGLRAQVLAIYGDDRAKLGAFRAGLKTDVCDALKNIDAVLLGQIDCNQLFDHPGQVALDTANVLFAESFAGVLIEILKSIDALSANLDTARIDAVVATILAASGKIVAKAGKLVQLFADASAGMAVWCKDAVNLADFVRYYVSDLVPDPDVAIAAVGKLKLDIQDIQDPSSPPDFAFEQARKNLAGSIAALDQPLRDWKSARSDLLTTLGAFDKDTCRTTPDTLATLLSQVQRVMRLRHGIPRLLTKLSKDLKTIEQKAPGAAKDTIAATMVLLSDVVSAEFLLATNAAKQKLDDSLDVVIGAVSTDLHDEIGKALTDLEENAKGILNLATTTTIHTYDEVVQDVQRYAEQLEWQLCCSALKTAIPFAGALSADVDGAILTVIDLLRPPHDFANKVVQDFLDFLAQYPLIQDAVKDSVKDALRGSLKSLAADKDVLDDLEKQLRNHPDDLKAKLDVYKRFGDWSGRPPEQIGLNVAFQTLAQIVESLLRGNLSDVFVNPDLRGLANALADSLKTVAETFLPTSLHLNYTWHTALNPVLGFTPSTTDKALSLDVDVYVDFLSGKRSVKSTGTLEAFSLKLIEGFHLVTINFKPLTFTSVDGSKPTFSVTIDTVEDGEELAFLKPLAAWMGGSDSGFYIKPRLSPLGIEAGYTYSAGIITVGSLEFINVALSVGARLPFEKGDAEFFFSFASRDNPFLIAMPPYGGGGYVELTANASGIKSLTLSFAFGGVAALEFGPLKAQARLVAGIAMKRDVDSFSLTGFMQAVGHGNIACFSICVFIEVGIHQEGSLIFGYQDYAFEFSVGFFSVKYEVTATYTIQGGEGKTANGQQPGARGDAGTMIREGRNEPGVLAPDGIPCAIGRVAPFDARVAPVFPIYRTFVAKKAVDWGRYHESLATDLLIVG